MGLDVVLATALVAVMAVMASTGEMLMGNS
jgi:hypothetical protein